MEQKFKIEGTVTISLTDFQALKERAAAADEAEEKLRGFSKEIMGLIAGFDETEMKQILDEIDENDMTDKQIAKRFDEAVAKMKVFVSEKRLKRLKKERQIKKAERIMGIRLYDWQKEYIKEGNSCRIPQGRRTGRTTAHMLRQLLEDDAPMEVRLHKLQEVSDEVHGRQYDRIYFDDLLKLRETLAAGGMKIREIKVIKH